VRLAGRILIPLISIGHAFALKALIDAITGNFGAADAARTVMILAASIASLTVSIKLINQLVEYCSGIQQELFDKTMMLSVMDKVLDADIEVFDNPEYYDKMTSATRDSYAVSSILWSAIDTVSALISCIGAIAVLCASNWLFGAIITAACIPAALVSRNYTKLVYGLSLEQINEHRKHLYVYSLVTDKRYVQDIKLYNIGKHLRDKYTGIWDSLFKKRKTLVKKRTLLMAMFNILPEIATAFIIVSIALNALNGLSTVGDFSLYLGLITTLIGAVNALVTGYLMIYDNRQRIDTFQSFSGNTYKSITDGTKTLESIETIEFKSVRFRYPETDKDVLEDISFTVDRHEKAALVGINGSGKTTIVKLLLRFYDPTGGAILINGVNIKEYTLTGLRNRFSTYFQNSSNYGFTLGDNITLGDLEKQKEESAIIDAADRSGAKRVLEKAPDGLDTVVYRIFDDKGIELSGGESQSLALARAFFRDRDVLILDEPSSSLDPEAEDKLFKSIKNICENKTVLFTSQRLSNIFLADKVIVIENGKVLEIGTQKELLSMSGRYAELFSLQAEKLLMAFDNTP